MVNFLESRMPTRWCVSEKQIYDLLVDSLESGIVELETKLNSLSIREHRESLYMLQIVLEESHRAHYSVQRRRLESSEFLAVLDKTSTCEEIRDVFLNSFSSKCNHGTRSSVYLTFSIILDERSEREPAIFPTHINFADKESSRVYYQFGWMSKYLKITTPRTSKASERVTIVNRINSRR